MNFKEGLAASKEYGVVNFVNHPIVRASGLPTVKVDEIVIFEDDKIGHVSAIKGENVEIISYSKLPPVYGTRVTKTGNLLSIKISPELLGKVVDPFCKPLFTYSKTKSSLKLKEEDRPIDVQPPALISRTRIKRQLVSGVSVIDSVIPLGRGQRELVVGDRKTGKTSTLLTLIKAQVNEGAIIIYVQLAKEKSLTKNLKEYLEADNLMQNVVIVATGPDDSPSLVDMAPYSAMTIAEYFKDNGMDVVLILDDLTTHAKYYREISLLAKKFPGRDSYPGDVFYKHARLLERAGNFKVETNKLKEASITAFAIAETTSGLLTDYIVSNLISITDGHIHFDDVIFNKGRRPAIDIFLSVTRVGKQTQSSVSRHLTREVMSLMNKYAKSANFKHLSTELSDDIREILIIGDQIYAFFEQSYQRAMPINVQIIFLALILKKIFINEEDFTGAIRSKKKNLYQNYKIPGNKKLMDELVHKSKNYAEFTDKLEQVKDQILSLC